MTIDIFLGLFHTFHKRMILKNMALAIFLNFCVIFMEKIVIFKKHVDNLAIGHFPLGEKTHLALAA
jgi:hypothetical protein